MFKNLVGLKLEKFVLYHTNAYHKYIATLRSNVDAKKDVPDVSFADIKCTEFCACRATCENG